MFDFLSEISILSLVGTCESWLLIKLNPDRDYNNLMKLVWNLPKIFIKNKKERETGKVKKNRDREKERKKESGRQKDRRRVRSGHGFYIRWLLI